MGTAVAVPDCEPRGDTEEEPLAVGHAEARADTEGEREAVAVAEGERVPEAEAVEDFVQQNTGFVADTIESARSTIEDLKEDEQVTLLNGLAKGIDVRWA